MGHAAMKKLEGFSAMGGEVPFLDPHAVVIVGLDVKESSEHWYAFCPRADEKLEDEWIEDIRSNGVRQAIDVFRDGDKVVLLEGRCRVRAARIVYDEQKKAGVPVAERVSVRCNIRRGSANELFGFNVGSENRKQRSPLQRAQLMQHAGKFGADEKAIAAMFSVTVQTVKNTLALFDLAGDVQKAVNDGVLPLREAIKLADKPREEQKAILKDLVDAGATKGAKAANGIAAAKKGEKIVVDTSKMRSRGFLEKWREVIKKDERFTAVKVPLNDVLKFVLGGPIPSDFPDRVKESLVEAGFKHKR